MVKFFVTGDNHFGKKYDRYPEVKDKLIQSRFDSLKDMVKKAEDSGCEMFVVTGDMFDNINNIKVSDVNQIVGILAAFSGTVVVIPGNHDYYTGDEKVWKDFEKAMSEVSNNITLIREFKPFEFDCADTKVVVYPAYCQSKHAKQNNLDWIKKSTIDKNVINVGIAHGAIQGITPDMKEEYFLMTESELEAIPVDAWFIGHTHISYPNNLLEDKGTAGYKVFNAGTHEQIDLHNNTEGNSFIISIEKNDGVATVLASKYVSGKIRYLDKKIEVNPTSETALADAIKSATGFLNKNTIVRIKLSGSVKPNEYQNKFVICKEILSDALTYEVEDSELSEEITIEKIRSEFAETSFAAQLMEQLIDNPTELQMTYQLLQECKED